MQPPVPDHYAALGLDQRCTTAQVRAAYRLLAKQHHPDVNPGSPDALARTQAINAAHEVLSDPDQRLAYDRERSSAKRFAVPVRAAKGSPDIAQEIHLRIEELLRGTSLEVRVDDPANPDGPEIYPLTVPDGTALGTRFRVPRTASPGGGFVVVRVRVRPDFRFKARGTDLRCDLRITPQRAAQGGVEMVVGVLGSRLRVTIPPRVTRGEVLRLPGEGLPKPRGGRGDLLVRIVYRPEVRITRKAGR